MAAFITRKKSLLIFLSALYIASGVSILLHFLLLGPKLGPHYDFLMSRRTAPAVSRELLLIDTDDIMEGGAAVQVLLTLIEMDAAALVIETPVLGISAGRISEDEIWYRFDEEYTLLGRNIRNLFEAIRIGSVSPLDSEKYVEELVELSLRGKDRLASALVHQDEAGMALMDKSVAAFGKVWRAGDLRPVDMDTPWYSKPRPDWDGTLRRISPVLSAGNEAEQTVHTTEHVIYAALKSLFPELYSEYTEFGPVLVCRGARNGEDSIIPLDRSGAILIEQPEHIAFRRLPLELFLKYEEMDRTLQRLLREADSIGIYSGINPENSPVFLFEYTQSLKDEMLEAPDPSSKTDWIHARSEYFSGLDDFLSGPVETNLVTGYEELIASEQLEEEEIARLTALRDELIRHFVTIRENYYELRDLRLSLKENLDSSFVILGPAPAGSSGGEIRPAESASPSARTIPEGVESAGFFKVSGNREPAATEVSAVLANTILSGRAIDPGQTRYVLFWSLLAVVVCLLIIFRLRSFAALVTGLVLSILIGAGFSWDFIISGYWIDPLIPLSGSLAGTLVVFSASQVIIRREGRRFLLAYGPYVSSSCLKQLIRRGRPLTTELIRVKAAVIAVRKIELLPQEDRGNPLAGAQAAEIFREEISRFFKKAGGIIIGCDGDLVLGCFGSPLERIALGGMKADPSSGADPYARNTQTPAARASAFIAEVLADPGAGTNGGAIRADTSSWCFGVDSGECAFGYMPVSGYSAFGRPVVRSRILSSLAPRYNVQVVVSAAVNESLPDIPVRKLNILKEQDGSEGEAFYQLVMK
jgi:class 3 adenylate cyclase